MPVKIILASRSPRRAELLTAAGISHSVRADDVDETPIPGEDALDYVQRLALAKALAVTCAADEVVIGADTAVACGTAILGKPSGDEDAARMLRLLSQAVVHEVVTGVALVSGSSSRVFADVSSVWFGSLTEDEIREYVATGEPRDKAGAYAIQGVASRYVTRIDGSYSNVVGLPIARLWQELREFRSSLS